MSEFLLSELDFIFLLYGLSFLLLAAVCLSRGRKDAISWRWLGLFGLFHGANEWLDLLSISVADTMVFTGIRVTVMAVSFIFLLEFARGGLATLRGKAPAVWVCLPLLVMAIVGSLGHGWAGINVGIRTVVGFLAAAGAAGVLWAHSTAAPARQKLWLRVLAAAMGAYAVAAGLITPRAPVFLADVLNHEWFLACTGVPVQAVRTLLAIIMTVSLWRYSVAAAAPDKVGEFHGAVPIRAPLFLLGILAAGWIATIFVGNHADSQLRGNVMARAMASAAGISPQHVQALACSEADVGTDNYRQLKERMVALRGSARDVRFVYLTQLAQGKVKFLVESEPDDSPDHSPCGSVYEDASAGFYRVFSYGQAMTEGPHPDKWGVWVSGIAPLRDAKTHKVIAALGMDIAADRWAREIAIARLGPIGITCLVGILVLGSYVVNARLRESAQVLLESQQQYRSLVEGSPNTVQLFDSRGRYLTVNEPGLRTMNCALSDLVGRPYVDVWPPQTRPLVQSAVTEVLSGRRTEFEAPFRRGDGQEIVWQVTLNPSSWRGRRVTQFVGVCSDITVRTRAEEALRQRDRLLGAVSEATAALLTITDLSLSVAQALQTVGRAAGVDRVYVFENHDESGTGRRLMSQRYEWACETAAPEIDNPQLQNLSYDSMSPTWYDDMASGAATNGIVKDMAAPIRDLLESQGIVSVLLLPIMVDGHYWGFIGFDDCHCRRRWDETESSILTTLGSAIGSAITRRRAEMALDETRRHAEAAARKEAVANAAKSDFLARMSHEIRTPMNGVVGMTDLLTRTTLTDQQRRYARIVKSSALSLLTIINDILDFSKIEAGMLTLHPREFDLRTVVEDTVEMFARAAEEKCLELVSLVEAPVPFQVRGDADRLRQILVNLIGNAMKFTEHGEVVVRARLVRVSGAKAQVRFTVRDTGAGISPENAGRLFKSFSQVDSFATRKHGGTGLGLAICKRLAEMMGGQTGLESEEGAGSTFWFTVMLDTCNQPPRQTARDLADLSRKPVLVVDDNAASRQAMCELLNSWGLVAKTSSGGAEAVEALRRHSASDNPFGIVLADLQMPQMTGETLLRTIMSDATIAPTVRVLMVPSETSLEDGAFYAVAHACVFKPVHQSRLFDEIVQAVARSKGREALPQGAAAAAVPAAVQPRDASILLAEDNEVNQELAVEILRMSGFRCEVVTNGRDAVDLLMKKKFDLVLMDCQMPEMDGLDATRIIRDKERIGMVMARHAARIPIIALTANAVSGERQKCLDAGMDGYIAKPFVPDELIRMIESTLAPAPGRADASSSQDAAPSVPFDLADLQRRCLNNVQFMDKMLGKFAETIPGELHKLEAAAAAGNAPETRRLAHSIKGAAANLSAGQLRQAAYAVEQAGQAGDITAAAQRLPRVRAELERCLEAIPGILTVGGDH
ncbi:MAG: response regulator [Planctomycetaceae bacterium]|nr:response regulator [Planctomycetaceae bacterium]